MQLEQLRHDKRRRETSDKQCGDGGQQKEQDEEEEGRGECRLVVKLSPSARGVCRSG